MSTTKSKYGKAILSKVGTQQFKRKKASPFLVKEKVKPVQHTWQKPVSVFGLFSEKQPETET
ncbi:hypothetical protein [Rufibacter ruber]|uniref:hypothetical protein n=1 Tax=Rufibacter ruber TaxID=1783499 RepID=UPI000833284D|nr:hypothetical protein [Rufibacter ruber]